MSLQIRRLIRQNRICHAVGFVEPVGGKLFDQVKNVARYFLVDAVGPSAFDELFLLLGHQLFVLLPHRTAQ